MTMTAGVDLGGTKVSVAAIDARGRVKKKVVIPTNPSDGTASVIVGLEKLLAEDCVVEAIGVGIAAFVGLDGKAAVSPNLSFKEPDVGKAVEERFGIPVAVDNDANLAALAEARFGSGVGSDPMLMLTLGTGVGGGVVIEGELYRGARGFAAEFGHMVIERGGPECACGREGCLEALTSGSAIARMGKEAMKADPDGLIARLSNADPAKVSGELVADAAASGDKGAREVIHGAGTWLGEGLAVLVNAFDPSVIVIGGGVVSDDEISELLLQPARARMKEGLASSNAPEVLRARLGNDAGMIGAAALAADLNKTN